jgi:hypothetical protein
VPDFGRILDRAAMMDRSAESRAALGCAITRAALTFTPFKWRAVRQRK